MRLFPRTLLGARAKFHTYHTMPPNRAEKKIYTDFLLMGCRQFAISETGFIYKPLIQCILYYPMSILIFSIYIYITWCRKGDNSHTMLNRERA